MIEDLVGEKYDAPIELFFMILLIGVILKFIDVHE